MSALTHPPIRITCIGAGPGALMLLERIIANQDAEHPGLPLHIDLIDPHEPGGGRIWRRDQSPLLKLNTLVGDDSVFTDDSCTIEGPIRPGPSLQEWIELVLTGEIARPEWWDEVLERELHSVTEHSFPTRRLNSAYLSWAYEEVLRRKHSEITVQWHRDRAVHVEEPFGEAETAVVLESGERLSADIVVYLLGHNGSAPSLEASGLRSFAERHGLAYVAPAFTAEADFSAIEPGAEVIVRGMGLAAVDLVVLLTEGRGGRYERVDGSLRYRPSGREPVLHLGSRRGVPYRSKITSKLAGDPVALEYVGEAFRDRIAGRTGVDFDREVLPLVIAELITGYYRELFTAHPDRVLGDWAEFSGDLRSALASPGGHRSTGFRKLVEDRVPNAEDRFDFDVFDRPLEYPPVSGAGEPGPVSAPLGAEAQEDALQQRVLAHIAEDLRHRNEQRHSATQGLFLTALFAFMSLAEIPREVWESGDDEESRFRITHFASKSFSGLFSYLASGPPGHRLEEFQALAAAGLLRFLGGDIELDADEERGRFVASGRAVTERGVVRSAVAAGALVDAWLPEANVATSDNPLLRELVRDALRREEAGGPVAVSLGLLQVTEEGRLPGLRNRFAVGATTSVFSGAFTRPGIDSFSFRRFDRFARAVLADAKDLDRSIPMQETRQFAKVA